MTSSHLLNKHAHDVPADRICHQLQLQQHLNPHQSLAGALRQTHVSAVWYPQAVQQALHILQLDSSRKIGRLKQCELAQLSRTIQRLGGCANTKTPSRALPLATVP